MLVDAVVLILHARGRASPCVAIHFEGIVLDQWAPVRNNPCHPGSACLLEMSRLSAYELVEFSIWEAEVPSTRIKSLLVSDLAWGDMQLVPSKRLVDLPSSWPKPYFI